MACLRAPHVNKRVRMYVRILDNSASMTGAIAPRIHCFGAQTLAPGSFKEIISVTKRATLLAAEKTTAIAVLQCVLLLVLDTIIA